MPETIDGVVYPTTPVIPASANTPAGGNRPYPTGASPGKAMWQLLLRYAQELDKFESGPIRTLTDTVKALGDRIDNTDVKLPKRLVTKTASQSGSPNTEARLTWVSDTTAGDLPSDGLNTTITFDGTGLFTCTKAGLYLATIGGGNDGFSYYRIRKNGTTISQSGNNSTACTGVFYLAANNTVDFTFTTSANGGNAPAGIRASLTRLGS